MQHSVVFDSRLKTFNGIGSVCLFMRFQSSRVQRHFGCLCILLFCDGLFRMWVTEDPLSQPPFRTRIPLVIRSTHTLGALAMHTVRADGHIYVLWTIADHRGPLQTLTDADSMTLGSRCHHQEAITGNRSCYLLLTPPPRLFLCFLFMCVCVCVCGFKSSMLIYTDPLGHMK